MFRLFTVRSKALIDGVEDSIDMHNVASDNFSGTVLPMLVFPQSFREKQNTLNERRSSYKKGCKQPCIYLIVAHIEEFETHLCTFATRAKCANYA